MEGKDITGPRKRQMQCPAEQPKKTVLKRARNPPKRFDELAPGSPKDDQDGSFVFLTFEDGYDAKIFKACDVLHKDEKRIACFSDLKPGDGVLARWSDNKFYNATVGYIGRAEKSMDAKKTTKKGKKVKDAASQRFYSIQESTSVQEKTIFDQDGVTQHLDTLPQHHSPSNEVLIPPSPTQPQYHSLPAQPLYQPLYTQLPVQLSPIQLQYHTPMSQPIYQPLHTKPQYGSSSAKPPHQPPPIQQPLHQYPSQQTPDLNQQQYPVASQKTGERDRFLEMLYSPSVPEKSVLAEESQASSSNFFDSSTSSDDTYIIERSPILEYGEPSCKEFPPWKPCKECKGEITKLMEEEEKKLEEVLFSIRGDQLHVFKNFLESIGKLRPEVGVGATKPEAAKQELYPESGLYVSSIRLAAIHAEAKKDCLRLFHLLFDEFFSSEECQNTVAFGKHGKVPEGKTVLEKSKVNGLLTYVMHCGTWIGWTPVEKAKVKKALINKCRGLRT